MSVLNQSGEEQVECPLCMEPLEVDDLHFYPCTCGYQICRFCWNRIREGENGLCPACRKAYPENPADFTPLSQEQVAAIKTEKKAREAKRRNKTLESRKALANVRVVQNNLVFVVGLPVRLADPEILKRQEYFGKYGKIHKVVINQSTTYAGSQGPSASAYVTYVSPADALRAIQGVNNVTLDGRVLKGSLGTTKYCANFMKNQPCPKPDCMYLHELGDPKASFTKEEMHAGLHQVYERKLHNQLLAQGQNNNNPGNTSTNADKGSSKDGNPSNFIPTTVVTSSHINVVNSSKSNKKDQINGSGSSNGSASSSSSGSGSGSGKEAWPSLGASPPASSPARHPASPSPSPRPDHWPTLDRLDKGSTEDLKPDVKSQENGTSESSSPTQMSQPQPAPSKSKDRDSKSSRKQENTQTSNNNNSSKKNKNEKQKSKRNSTANEEIKQENKPFNNTQTHNVFENENTSQYLSNELDELESDRHSLLENHDLLDNSDHSLLEDDNTHNLLNDANNEVLMMQRHREMLAGLVDNNINNHMLHLNKSPLMNGYGLLDRELYERGISQMGQNMGPSLEQKEMMMRPDLLRHTVMEPKHYMPTTTSIGLESASELLGANFHPNPNMLPPFGMRVDNSMANNTMSNNSMGNSLGGNPMPNTLGNSMGNTMGNSMGNALSGFMLHNQQMMQNQQQMQAGMVNGFDNPQNASEGRYLAENMDKFFTDFHKAQQMRLLLGRQTQSQGQGQPQIQPQTQGQPQQVHYHPPHNMISADRLEMEHKQRMSNMRAESGRMVGTAAGDADDDLDFDPFKETQKALAEMMETEMMQTGLSGDNLERFRRSRLPPPGFGHINVNANAFPMQQQRMHNHPQGYSNSTPFQDWTQMDPAIMSMSTSAHFPKQSGSISGNNTGINSVSGMNSVGGSNSNNLSAHQQELFARFNQLQLQPQPNGLTKLQVPLMQQWANAANAANANGGGVGNKLGWGYSSIPLPPGFAPAAAQPPHGHTHTHPHTHQHTHTHPAECIDAK